MSHILFVDEGYRRSAEAIARAKALGHDVSLVSSAPPRFSSAHLSHVELASPFDIAASVSAAKRIHGQAKISGVVTLMERLPAVAAIREVLGLPGLTATSARLSQHKLLMRQRFEKTGMRQPKFCGLSLDSSDESISCEILQIGLPAVLKPVGGAGSGGVYVLRSESEIRPVLASLRRMMINGHKTFGYFLGDLIVEGYLHGPQYSVEGYVQNGRTHVVSVTEKFIADDSIEVAHLVPARLGATDVARIRSLSELSVVALDLSDCLFHLEISKTAEGFRVIEMNARMGGGCIATHLIPVALSIDMVQIMCDVACGKLVKVRALKNAKFAASTFVRGRGNGSILRIEGLEAARLSLGVLSVIHESSISRIQSADERAGDDRPCVIVTSSLTAEGALECGRIAAELIRVITSD